MDIIGPILALIVGGLFALWLVVFVVYHSSRLIIFLAHRYIPVPILNPLVGFFRFVFKVIGKLLYWVLFIVLFVIILSGTLVLGCLLIPFVCFPIIFI